MGGEGTLTDISSLEPSPPAGGRGQGEGGEVSRQEILFVHQALTQPINARGSIVIEVLLFGVAIGCC